MAEQLTLHVLVGEAHSLKCMLTARALSLSNIVYRYYTDSNQLKTPEFKALSPNGTAPVLETSEGAITDSDVIARYLSGTKAYLCLFGMGAFEKAQVDMWLGNIESVAKGLKWHLNSVTGSAPFDQAQMTEAFQNLPSCLQRIEDHLSMGRRFIVGSGVTVADISLASLLFGVRNCVLNTDIINNYPQVLRWYKQLTDMPFFSNYLGRVFEPAGRWPYPDTAAVKAHLAKHANAAPEPVVAPQQPKSRKISEAEKPASRKVSEAQKPASRKVSEAEKPAEAPKKLTGKAAYQAKMAAQKQAKEEPKKVEDDDDFDPFGAETEEDKKAKEDMKKNQGAKKAEGPKKKVVICKSQVKFDVKGYEMDQDWDAMAKKIMADIKMDGLVWQDSWKTPVIAFGMKKLEMVMIIEDEKISTDDVFEKIEEYEDVQSVDIVTFSKA